MSITLMTTTFDPGGLLSQFTVGRTRVGAVVSFTGIARADLGDDTRLELEAYPGFTEREIGKIADQATDRFSLHDLVVVHRIGVIAPGEAIVFVATAASKASRRWVAADFLMDYLKSRAPFWKKQSGPGGEAWVEPTARDRADAARWD